MFDQNPPAIPVVFLSARDVLAGEQVRFEAEGLVRSSRWHGGGAGRCGIRS